MKLDRLQTVLVVIDVQEKLMPVIAGADTVIANLERLIRGTHILGVPVIVTEQYVRGLGPTVAPLRAALDETHGYRPIEKSCFSAQGCEPFVAQLAAHGTVIHGGAHARHHAAEDTFGKGRNRKGHGGASDDAAYFRFRDGNHQAQA